jgi:hypothetical protein
VANQEKFAAGEYVPEWPEFLCGMTDQLEVARGTYTQGRGGGDPELFRSKDVPPHVQVVDESGRLGRREP